MFWVKNTTKKKKDTPAPVGGGGLFVWRGAEARSGQKIGQEPRKAASSPEKGRNQIKRSEKVRASGPLFGVDH